MAQKREKVFVPMYKMGLGEYYLLLRLAMERSGRKSINGVGKEFLASETYKNSEKLLKNLVKRDYVEKGDSGILVKEGLQRIFNQILASAHCMSFQNPILQKKGQLLSCYYAEGRFVGVLLDKKETVLVSSEDPEAVYMAFEKIFEAKAVSASFKVLEWNKLFDAKGEGMLQPVREAFIMHSSNASERVRFSVTMVADKKKLQIVRGADSLGYEKLNRETVQSRDWFGIILQEFERLKREHEAKSKKAAFEKAAAPRNRTEYEKIISTPGFPRSGAGFVFWSLKQAVLNFPGMVMQMVKKKSLALVLYPVWAILLFVYNMYITCFFNDTFMLDRRSRLGNLSPYLMAGTLRTPSDLKGFQSDWGLIDTVFLVWPLMMLLTLLGRHLILQIKRRKLSFVTDIFGIRQGVADCYRADYGKGRSMWVTLAITWVLGFLVMNPVTLFLIALFCFLIFAQGSGNEIIQFAMLWACASGRKKIDAGKRKAPDSRRYRILFFHMGWGMAVYGAVSVLLWFVADYHFWVRFAVTLLMLVFALMQAFWPGIMSGRKTVRTVGSLALMAIVLTAVCFISAELPFVLADDGGITESGSFWGWLQNAGFSTILGLTLLTLGLAFGGPLAATAIISGAIGLGTFIAGATDTPVGDYVRKTARQYFFGAEPGENKTLFCTATEWANFLAGFANPGNLTGTAAKVFQGGKLLGDGVSLVGDAAGTYDHLKDYMAGDPNVSEADLFMDIVGLSLDVVGLKDDIAETPDVFRTGSMDSGTYRESYEKYQDHVRRRDVELNNAETNVRIRRQAEVDAENLRHQQKMDSIQESIDRLNRGEIDPPGNVDVDTYRSELQNSLNTESRIHSDKLSDIRDEYDAELNQTKSEITDRYAKESDKMVQEVIGKMTKDGYSAEQIVEKTKEFIETNLDGEASQEAGSVPPPEAVSAKPAGTQKIQEK